MVLIGFLLFAYALNMRDASITGNFIANSDHSYPVLTCYDSDFDNIYEKGSVLYADKEYKDACFNGVVDGYSGDYVVEHYCKYGEHFSKIKYCADSCINGRCQ